MSESRAPKKKKEAIYFADEWNDFTSDISKKSGIKKLEQMRIATSSQGRNSTFFKYGHKDYEHNITTDHILKLAKASGLNPANYFQNFETHIDVYHSDKEDPQIREMEKKIDAIFEGGRSEEDELDLKEAVLSTLKENIKLKKELKKIYNMLND